MLIVHCNKLTWISKYSIQSKCEYKLKHSLREVLSYNSFLKMNEMKPLPFATHLSAAIETQYAHS